MAEKAQLYLEKSLPELHALRDFLDPEELHTVIKQRTIFENALTRRSPLLSDFNRYIEFEKKLNEQLLEKARSFRLIERKRRRKHGEKKKLNVLALVSRHQRKILNIYARAVARFHADIPLWDAYIAFDKQIHATKTLTTVFAQAIKLHPTIAHFWVGAARHEFDENGSADAARSLMQRGLRMCKSAQMWSAYLRLELDFVSKLEKRLLLLRDTEPENIEGDMVSFKKQKKVTNSELISARDEAAKSDNAILNGAIQFAIVNAIDNSADFNQKARLEIFHEMYRQVLLFPHLRFANKLLERLSALIAQYKSADGDGRLAIDELLEPVFLEAGNPEQLERHLRTVIEQSNDSTAFLSLVCNDDEGFKVRNARYMLEQMLEVEAICKSSTSSKAQLMAKVKVLAVLQELQKITELTVNESRLKKDLSEKFNGERQILE